MPQDAILRFGPIEHGAAKEASSYMGLIANVVRNSEGQPIELVVRRADLVKRLHLTPHVWSGRGLVGCHILPYPEAT